MALLWIEGFEGFGTTDNANPSPSGVMARKYASVVGPNNMYLMAGRIVGHSLEIRAFGDYFTTPTLTTNATLVVGLGYYYTQDYAGLIVNLYDGATQGVNLRLESGGELGVYRGSTNLGTTSGLGLTAGNWYWIELKVVCGDAGSYELRVGGVNVLSEPEDTKAGSHNYHDQVQFGYGGGASNKPRFDDIYILDGSGSVNNDFLGNHKVTAIFPDGDVGGYTDFTCSTGTDHYALVDENPTTDNTDYVESAGNEKQTIAIDDTTSSGTFTLTYSGQTTAAINYDANAAAVQTALENLSNIAPGDVTVMGGPGPSTDWVVEFTGSLANTDVAAMIGDGTLLVGGSTTVTITETVKGGAATDLWDYGAVGGIGVIAGIQINTQARETDANPFTLKTIIKSDATVDADAGQAIGTTNYKCFRRISETDPYTTSAWTTSGVNAAEFGVRVG